MATVAEGDHSVKASGGVPDWEEGLEQRVWNLGEVNAARRCALLSRARIEQDVASSRSFRILDFDDA